MPVPSERQKMLQGLLYNAEGDAELVSERAHAAELCFELNHTRPSEAQARQKILRQLLGRHGRQLEILSDFHCDYGYNIEVGENFYMNYGGVILDCATVSFGDNVLVGPNCGFYTASHPLDARRRGVGLELALPISVGDDVWLGGGVSVLPGVSIGSGTVVGAGSVVTHDLPAGVIAVGNPCRVLRRIDEEEL